MRPIARIGDIRACSACAVYTPNWNVVSTLRPVVVLGTWDSHCGVAVTGSPIVVAGGIPVCGIGDTNAGCWCVKPPHPPMPFVTGDFIVVVT